MSNMDPFDEFEFKPLTEGLGFHKKAVNLKEGLDASGVLDDELRDIPNSVPQSLLDTPAAQKNKSNRFEDVLSALEKAPLHRNVDLDFTETFARETPTQSPFPRQEAFRQPTEPAAPAPAPAARITKKTAAPTVGARRGSAEAPAPARKLSAATISLPSAVLDLVIVVAIALVFMVSLLTITKVDLNVVIKNLSNDVMIQISLGAMFLAVMQMYVVISRSFFGRTLGEWTFDLQVGRDNEQKFESYPLRIILRSFIVTLTGLIFLPLVSALIRRDVAGGISGVRLYRQS